MDQDLILKNKIPKLSLSVSHIYQMGKVAGAGKQTKESSSRAHFIEYKQPQNILYQTSQ